MRLSRSSRTLNSKLSGRFRVIEPADNQAANEGAGAQISSRRNVPGSPRS